MISVRLCDAPFDAGAALAEFMAGRYEDGAVASFVGVCRATGPDGPLTALVLDHYPGFTEAQISNIAETIAARFAASDVLVIHRVGVVRPGETIVLAAAAAPHRREAFEAVDALMDYLKSEAPFWKREEGPSGARWVEPTARDLADKARWTLKEGEEK